MGLVEIRRGSGAYVLRRPESMVTASVSLMLDLEEQSVENLMQLRFWLETIGVKEAAFRVPELTDQEQDRIRAALRRLEESESPSERIAADTVFHATVVGAAGNPYLSSIYESLHTAVLSFEFKQWVRSETVPHWLRKRLSQKQLELHEAIANAILKRDPEAGQQAVADHHHVMTEHMHAALARSAGGR